MNPALPDMDPQHGAMVHRQTLIEPRPALDPPQPAKDPPHWTMNLTRAAMVLEPPRLSLDPPTLTMDSPIVVEDPSQETAQQATMATAQAALDPRVTMDSSNLAMDHTTTDPVHTTTMDPQLATGNVVVPSPLAALTTMSVLATHSESHRVAGLDQKPPQSRKRRRPDDSTHQPMDTTTQSPQSSSNIHRRTRVAKRRKRPSSACSTRQFTYDEATRTAVARRLDFGDLEQIKASPSKSDPGTSRPGQTDSEMDDKERSKTHPWAEWEDKHQVSQSPAKKFCQSAVDPNDLEAVATVDDAVATVAAVDDVVEVVASADPSIINVFRVDPSSCGTTHAIPGTSSAGQVPPSLPQPLPLSPSRKHPDLTTISATTLMNLLRAGPASRHYIVVDCRFPYEFRGGHIRGAWNLYTSDMIFMELFGYRSRTFNTLNVSLIFHCEFSSHRGPKMYRLLRQMDRDYHRKMYPKLRYPELYLLKGGYRAFYNESAACRQFCEPQSYCSMVDTRHKAEMKFYTARCTAARSGSLYSANKAQDGHNPATRNDEPGPSIAAALFTRIHPDSSS